MSKQIYGWKRFWCPRSGSINLADGGYLPDPDEERGKAYNPDLVTFEAISHLPCLALLGEPGIGKTQALEVERNEIVGKIREQGDQVLFLDLRSYGSEDRLVRSLFDSPEFKAWQAGTHRLHIFLDSFDECLLRVETLAALLVDEFKHYRDAVHCLYLRIACRTAIWQSVLEEGLEEIWGENSVGVYELAPLRRIDVIEAAKAKRCPSDDFLKEVNQKNIVPLVIKPITLEFLLNTYHRHGGQFPPNQKLHELYLEGCKLLCEEINESRRDSNQRGNLDVDQRLIVAARIAAITILTNRFAVWTGVDQGNVPIEDVILQKLCHGYETVNGREFEITRVVIKKVLDTGLFSSRGLHRMGWAHQTYAEFLAAWYLKQRNLNLLQLLSLILHPDGRVIPQLQETIAWLASMRSDVFQKVMETDPDMLLQSDLASTSEADKVALVEILLNLHNQERLPYNYHSTWLYKKLDHSTLAKQLKGFICDRHKSINSRNTAIDIAEACNVTELSVSLSDIALDTQESNQVRLNAAIAVCKIEDEVAKAKLKPLAMLKSRNEFEDELKGCGLRAVWPKHVTLEEIFNNLSRPKSNSIGGRYQDFVAEELGQGILENDLPIALRWLEKQPTRRDLHYPFNALSDHIMLKAWERLENPEILSEFAQIALLRLREYDELIDANEISFKQLLEENDFKRRQLLEVVISIIPESEKEPLWLAGYSEYSQLTPLRQDFFWLIEKLQTSGFDHIQSIYSKLIRWKLDRRSTDQISAVLTASQINPTLRAEFASELEPILLNSPRANQEKSEYIERETRNLKNQRKILEPSPKERVLTCLIQFETGSVDAWLNLCQEMTLLPTSTHYNERYEADITTLPGWHEADEGTKVRIIAAAKKYIYQGEPETGAWLGKNSFCHSALAGYRALRLISVTDPNFISTISADVWQKWAAIILDFPNAREDKDKEIRQQLIKIAYQNAHDEFTRVLIILIEQENTQHGSVDILHEIKCCWDERLADVLINKVQDKKLKARSTGDLLKELLVHRVERAKAFAESLISLPLPTDGEAREKAIVAAQMLMRYSEDAGWSVVWSAIQRDCKFGREVLEAVSYAVKYEGNIEQRLKEDCVADLYIFLVQQYPNLNEQRKDSDDTELSGVEAYIVRPEDSIRTWKDYIPQRLQELGTHEACDALRKIIHKLPELKDKLQWRLLETEVLARRKTWQPPTPEEILQLVTNPEPSISNSIKKIEKLMTEQSNPNLSGATFNAPVNFAPNYGIQAQNLNMQNTEQHFEVVLTDFKQFVTDLQTQYPNVNTPETATQTITVQAKQLPQARSQNFLNLKRLWNGSKKAGLKVGEHFAENNVWGKGAIAFLEGVSEDT